MQSLTVMLIRLLAAFFSIKTLLAAPSTLTWLRLTGSSSELMYPYLVLLGILATMVVLWVAAPKIALWLVHPDVEFDQELPIPLDATSMARIAVGLLGLYFILTAVVAIASSAATLWMPPAVENASVDAFRSQATVNLFVNLLKLGLGLFVFLVSNRVARLLNK